MPIETIMLAIPTRDDPQIEALASAVIELAKPTGADVVIAHVFGEEEFRTRKADLDEPGGGLSADELAGRLATARELREQLEDEDIDVTIRGEVAEEPAQAIVDLATEVGADRLLIGGRRRSPAGKAVFGSTAQDVLLNAPCPVEFVRRD